MYLEQQGLIIGNADSNLYINMDQDSMIIIEVYVDEIIFGSDDDKMSRKFPKDMQSEFEISFLVVLTFFLGV